MTLSLSSSGYVVYDGGGLLKVERWESTVTGLEGIEMGIGVGFFVDAGSDATVCLSSMTPFPNKSFLQLLSGIRHNTGINGG